MLLLSMLMFEQKGFAWWFPALLLVPDVSKGGYAFNNRTGAFLYNLFHHKDIAILVFGFGYLIGEQYLELAGAIMFGYSSMDRIVDYGLKYPDSFQRTHLGSIIQK